MGNAIYGNRNLREPQSTGTAIYEKKSTGSEIFERSYDLRKDLVFCELCPSRALRARFGRDSTKIAIYGNCNLPEPQSTGTAVYGNRDLRKAINGNRGLREKQ